jgi:uncharacterized membrane protein
MFILRWIHFLAGITWIGLLYYFNFVQGEWFKEIDAAVKNQAVSKLVPRALWWFRWAAMFTFLSGFLTWAHMATATPGFFQTSQGVFITTGGLFATLMFLNVWLRIWPQQKIVIASTQTVLGGGQANPDAAVAGARAGLSSRHNVLFSIPMLFFMGASSHLPMQTSPDSNGAVLWGVILAIAALLEYNSVKGKLGPITTVRGVIHMGLLLTGVLYGVIYFLA